LNQGHAGPGGCPFSRVAGRHDGCSREARADVQMREGLGTEGACPRHARQEIDDGGIGVQLEKCASG